jgi:hypothetical protein
MCKLCLLVTKKIRFPNEKKKSLHFFPSLINRKYPWYKFGDKKFLDFATYVYILKDENFKK